jgi:hypothetical protein
MIPYPPISFSMFQILPIDSQQREIPITKFSITQNRSTAFKISIIGAWSFEIYVKR